MNEKLGQEPAFPTTEPVNYNSGKVMPMAENGMSKRFYAACAIAQGIMSSDPQTTFDKMLYEHGDYCSKVSNIAFKIADELLKQENE